jgi:2',3'-cyclic-nucleotide 2'-phosphodiesterase/3'-nucleotidase
MKKIFILFLISWFSILFSQQVDTLYFLQTTDVHGHLYPYDYFKDEEANQGLARIYTRIVEYRQKYKNVFLVDSGDMVQGTPMSYYFNFIETQIPNPFILAMNYMSYDAFAVGNHEIEQGKEVYDRLEAESDFPWLSANSILDDGNTYFQPYVILKKNNFKIGILGLTTPGIPMWHDKSLYEGITWEDMVETAKKYVKILKPQVDILIGLFHSGFELNAGSSRYKLMNLPPDNASNLVAEQVPGFDIIFGGHTHNLNPKERISIKNETATLKIISGAHGEYLGVAQLIIETSEDGFRIVEKNGWTESVAEVPPAEIILELTEYYHQKTLEFIRTDICYLSKTMNSKESYFKDTPIIELINKAQLDFTGVDISFACCFNPGISIDSGFIKVKDIYSIYPYENFLYVVELTGQQIKDYLEHSADIFIYEDENISLDPAIRGYNYDMAEGISYQINILQKPGERIQEIIDLRTKEPLNLKRKYKVALNSYRAIGGGGHMAAVDALDAEILFKSNMDIRTIMIDYLKKMNTIYPVVDNNWEIIFKN